MRPLLPVIEWFSQQVEEIDRILAFSIEGITREKGARQIIDALADWHAASGKPVPTEELEGRRQRAQERAEFASTQIASGFPVLFGHATVALWSALETLVDDIVVASLKANHKYLARDAFAKIRIPLSEYERLDNDDRMRYLVTELARSSNSDLRKGITRFEVLLESVDMGGAVSDGDRQTCFELWAVRNLLVHRSGITDRRFRELCPWLACDVGKAVSIGRAQYSAYLKFVQNYLVELMIRDMVRDGMGRIEAERRLRPSRQPTSSTTSATSMVGDGSPN